MMMNECIKKLFGLKLFKNHGVAAETESMGTIYYSALTSWLLLATSFKAHPDDEITTSFLQPERKSVIEW